MMTSKILERDIKTEIYDLELDFKGEEERAAEVDDEDEAMWERGQVLKGIEKGWNTADDGTNSNFYSKQAKLFIYIPPKPINYEALNKTDFDLIDTDKMNENIDKIEKDSRKLEAGITKLRHEIDERIASIKELNEIETFFMRFSRFLSEKMSELEEIELKCSVSDSDSDSGSASGSETRNKWEHFFDNVDVEDADLLDLPDIIDKLNDLNLNDDLFFKDVTELFVRYHFLAIDFNSTDPLIVWENSGLKDALRSISDPLNLLKNIYSNNPIKLKQICDGIGL